MATKKKCPQTGFKRACLEHGCEWYIHVLGKHPQTGNPIDHYGCAIAWIPVLIIESSQETRQAAAAVESFRNGVSETLTTFVERVTGAPVTARLDGQAPRQITGPGRPGG